MITLVQIQLYVLVMVEETLPILMISTENNLHFLMTLPRTLTICNIIVGTD